MNAPEAASVSSIDPREVRYYQRMADAWWDDTGPFWPLHRLNSLRIEWIVEQLQRSGMAQGPSAEPLRGLRVLDVGCGGGILSESLARRGAEVVGIDVVAKNLTIARRHATGRALPLRYRQVTAEALAGEGAKFDVVFNMEVVEHVAHFDGFMAACNTLVRSGGASFVSTINRNPLAWLTAIVGAEYVLRWLPRGTHRYRMLRRPGEVASRLSAGGLTPQQWSGVRVNPLTRRFSLQQSRLVNYMVFARKSA